MFCLLGMACLLLAYIVFGVIVFVATGCLFRESIHREAMCAMGDNV